MTAYLNENVTVEQKAKIYWKLFKYGINIFLINAICQKSATKCYSLFRVSLL